MATSSADAEVLAANVVWVLSPEGYAWQDYTFNYTNSSDADLYGDPPVVEEVSVNNQLFPSALVRLSHSMVKGVSYFLDYDGTTSLQFTVTAPANDELAPKGVYDIGLPLVTNGKYAGGGTLPLDESGDRLRVEGVDVIASKSVWHALLTAEGELYWDPSFGNPVNLKDPKPGDLRTVENQLRGRLTRLPLVRKAKVLVTFGGNSAFLNVSYETIEGATIKEQRQING